MRTPLRLQGRVLSASDTLVNTPQTISIALGALLTTLIDYRILVVLMAVVTAMAGVFLLSRRAIVPQENAEEPALA
jgi:uncharacterized protein involved in exopolysaccharide biosynthesis